MIVGDGRDKVAVKKCLKASQPVDLLVDNGDLCTKPQCILRGKKPDSSRPDNGDPGRRNTGDSSKEYAAAAISGFKVFGRSLYGQRAGNFAQCSDNRQLPVPCFNKFKPEGRNVFLNQCFYQIGSDRSKMESRDKHLAWHKERNLIRLRGRDLDDDVGLLV